MSELARKQADLVAAVTGTGPPPKGFDALRLDAARVALLRKRSRAVAAHWPGVAGDLGADLPALFASWAATRPTQGSQVDGHAFARAHRSRLGPTGLAELASAEAVWDFSTSPPTPRRGLVIRRVGGRLYVGLGGILHWPRPSTRRTPNG